MLGVVCMAWSLFEYVYKKHLLHIFPKGIQRFLLMMFVVGISFFCVVESYIIYIGQQVTTTQSTTVLILGAQLNGKEISRSLRHRLDSALQFYERYPNATFIVSGGQGPNEAISEAQAMRDYLVKQGMNPKQILLEATSRNTQENIQNTYALYAKDYLNNEKGLTVITNDFHMARTRFIAKQNGITNISAFPAKTDMDLVPVFYFREFFGFCKDFIISL